MKKAFLIVLVLSVIALGGGCWVARSTERSTVFSVPTDISPKMINVEGRAPKELTSAIKLVGGSTVLLHMQVHGVRADMVSDTKVGMGENKRIVRIEQFAPGNLASMTWSSDFVRQDADGAVSVSSTHVEGRVSGAKLLDSYSLYPPALWPEGATDALGSGSLWLSQDVYENLTKGHLSSFYFGLSDLEFERALHAKNNSKLVTSLHELKRLADTTIDTKHIDVYLMKTISDSEMYSIVINGTLTNVEVFVASSWFGKMWVMKNPYYPLVVQVKMNDAVKEKFGTLFDYEVTELKDVKE